MLDLDDLDQIVMRMSADELFALAAYVQDVETLEKSDPLMRHKDNNLAQRTFKTLDGRYRFITGGNKIGKTDVLAAILVICCKGRCKEFGINFPHKPPLRCWYGGRDRNILSDEPLKSIQRYLIKEDYDYYLYWQSGGILKMEIFADPDTKRIKSEIIFKPYNGDIGIWESANVHLVLLDEEPRRRIFSAIKAKIGVRPGYVLCAMTPDRGMSWTLDLFNGTDEDHGDLIKKGMLQRHQATVFENMMNFATVKGLRWIRFPVEHIDPIPGFTYRENEETGHTEVLAPDAFADYIDLHKYDSPEYLMRILGQYVSYTGKVYIFDEKKITFDYHEAPDLTKLKWFGALDWGYKDPFAYLLIGIDKHDNKWVFGEVYSSYLGAREQAQRMRALNERWGVKPDMVVADLQICNVLPERDAIKAHITSVKEYYMDELGDSYTIYRTEMMDKREPHIKRDMLRRYLIDGKIRFLKDACPSTLQELFRLEFKENALNQERTSGADHAEAALRYFFGAGLLYDGWASISDPKESREKKAYRHFTHEPIY